MYDSDTVSDTMEDEMSPILSKRKSQSPEPQEEKDIKEKEKKLFSCTSMVRYDNTPSDGSPPFWVCKHCIKFLLTEAAAIAHITKCKKEPEFKLNIEVIKGNSE